MFDKVTESFKLGIFWDTV